MYKGEDVCVHESDHLDLSLIRKYFLSYGILDLSVCNVRNNIRAKKMFSPDSAPKVYFRGHVSHLFTGKSHTEYVHINPTAAAIQDMRFVKENYPDIFIVAMIGPTYRRKFEKLADYVICRRKHSNLERKIAGTVRALRRLRKIK